MKISQKLLHAFISLSLLLGVATRPGVAVQTPESASDRPAQLRHIEQPILRIGLSLGGFALVGMIISSMIESAQAESEIRNLGDSIDHPPV